MYFHLRDIKTYYLLNFLKILLLNKIMFITAKNAIKMGLSIQQIIELTGLSEDSIKQLIAKKEN
jgi:hypothetical protein